MSKEHQLSRVISIADIDEETHSNVAKDLLELDNINHDPIFIHINSYGGNVYDMFGIIDLIRNCHSKIITICTGKAMSAAVPILAAGYKGERKIGKYSVVMLHEAVRDVEGKLSEIDNFLKHDKIMEKNYVDLLAEYTNISSSKMKKLLSEKQDCYLTAEEAVKLKIADIII
jgi:ATP-dependent Clp protease protease subunit